MRSRSAHAHSVRVELPGIRPTTFKLVEKAVQSFDLFRSSRRIGTARVEERGDWTARFRGAGGEWRAKGKSADDLLQLVGVFLLASESRQDAAEPVTKRNPELKAKGPDQKLGIRWAELLQKRQLAELDTLINEARKRIAAL